MSLRTFFLNTIMVMIIAGLSIPLNLQAQSETMEPDRVIEMEGNDDLRFTVENIKARPGEVIKVELTTVSDFPKSAMAHNFVLLALDADPQKVASASAKAHKNEYIAPNMEEAILAHTGLAGDGETVSVTFTVPDELGEYEYICSFPGHFSGGMKGTLQVSSTKAAL